MTHGRALNMHTSLQNALDDIASNRTSNSCKARAIADIEHQLAIACLPSGPSGALLHFLDLQDTFECNVPSRILTWISSSIPQLQIWASKASNDDTQHDENGLPQLISQSLSIIQGIVLHHRASKHYLGRRYALEIFVDLLLASRYIQPFAALDASSSSSASGKDASPPTLTSVVLDTLLCVLVDSPPSLRIFEEAKGVQAVVKILKRAGTPREVRMKCLEFIYFYLMDETPANSKEAAAPHSFSSPPSPTPTDPDLPLPARQSKSSIFPRTGSDSSQSSHSSTGSDASLSSFSSSGWSSSTHTSLANSRAPSPTKRSRPATPVSEIRSSSRSRLGGRTSPADATPRAGNTPEPNSGSAGGSDSPRKAPALKTKSLLMLRREVDYEPQSPKKAHAIAQLGNGTPGAPRRHESSLSRSSASSSSITLAASSSTSSRSSKLDLRSRDRADSASSIDVRDARDLRRVRIGEDDSDKQRGGGGGGTLPFRTMDEKKEILSGMLGNVDALVEGVRKAGIWGLA
ncbi:CDC14-domain-containing protein [Coniophora puteana RWD-64-598 SS2]|uniref:CDC14-domain-containing protein n=1 Tax=Coniophora puteana (strain RWD-64-598) TaxID=741705 RepID=A0A5M3MB78_CONPW|nr:CDC14-domain-containing protein [Coniophora puteana RWD-64-598 SS2]EIW76256.1 CDC14-domain-containing protein [Coniophora puteana RWD-64-598 SS2]